MVSGGHRTSSGIALNIGHSQGVYICVLKLSIYMCNLLLGRKC